jgi:hypothetical protein
MRKSVWAKNLRSGFGLVVLAILFCSCSTPSTPEPTLSYDPRLKIPTLLAEGLVSEVILLDILQTFDPIGIKEYRRALCLQDVLGTDYSSVYENLKKLSIVTRRQWSETISLVKTIEFRLIAGDYRLIEETEIYYRTMPWEMKGNPEVRPALIIEAFLNTPAKVEIFAYHSNGTGSTITCAEIEEHLEDVERSGWPYGE